MHQKTLVPKTGANVFVKNSRVGNSKSAINRMIYMPYSEPSPSGEIMLIRHEIRYLVIDHKQVAYVAEIHIPLK